MPVLNASTSASQFFTFSLRRKKRRYTINPPDVSYNVVYLGNVHTIMAGGEHCFEKPLELIWNAYCSRTDGDLNMQLEITRSGLKAETKEQGLTEYWAHRITSSGAPSHYPRIFCWIYKHDGKRLRPELRCHAVFCKRTSDPLVIHTKLQEFLHNALQEYRREKLAVQNARLTGSAGCPRRKKLLHTGSLNFRPPVCRAKSAPRLGSIDEEQEEPEADRDSICYHVASDIIRGTSSNLYPDVFLSDDLPEACEAASTNLCCTCVKDDQHQQERLIEFDSISDESGYHEDKLTRGHSEESYYSDWELLMLEDDYEDGEQQITSL